MNLQYKIREKINEDLAQPREDEIQQLNGSLRLLSKWRGLLLQNTFLKHHGSKVLEGPFLGLDILQNSAEGCYVPKLLGCYEQPLWPYIKAAISNQYSSIINIGCAEGYYAVGMARNMPDTKVFAFDIAEPARKICRELAVKNDVADRVFVNSMFQIQDFAKYNGEHTLIFCDIEGQELDLLDPSIAPNLAQMDLIVECHEDVHSGITKKLSSRFVNTHEITAIYDTGHRYLSDPPQWYKNLSHLDQLLSVWEWRAGPTPWLVMKSKR